MAWQQLSQNGASAEGYAMPSPIRRSFSLNGKSVDIPKRGKRLPAPNRLLEIHGLAGAIGEQLGLAWTAEQDVQRLVMSRLNRTPEHQRLVQRALAELAAHYALGGAHSLANFTLRVMLLNEQAALALFSRYPKANQFRPGSDERNAWLTFNKSMMTNLCAAAEISSNRFITRSVNALGTLSQSTPFLALEKRRGLDYHRRRPQSVEHVSPRTDVVTNEAGTTTLTMPSAVLEPEANADTVHEIVVAALEELRITMREIRSQLPKAIRYEGITYVFG